MAHMIFVSLHASTYSDLLRLLLDARITNLFPPGGGGLLKIIIWSRPIVVILSTEYRHWDLVIHVGTHRQHRLKMRQWILSQ